MREREESGLSIKAYCENAGFHENKYYYWQKKLRDAAYGELAIVQSDASNLVSPVFAEVKLAAHPLPPSSGSFHSNALCIEIAGMRFTAGGDYPADKLADLLQALNQPCF
jgi:hypothetical protein